MIEPEKYRQFYSNINKIYHFFINSPGSGILFCGSSNSLIIKEVDNIVINRLALRNFTVSELRIEPEKFDAFYDTLTSSLQENDGILLHNLNEIIIFLGNKFFRTLNFLREDIIELDKPVLFWLSEENISAFANKAPDFFQRRDRSVIYFPSDISLVVDKKDPGFEPLLSPATDKQAGDDKSALLRIAILENQLKEAESKQYDRKRIFTEIVIDLMNEYMNAPGNSGVEELYENYNDLIEKENTTRILLLKARFYQYKGEKYADGYEWDRALKSYFKAKEIRKELGDQAGLGATYNNIGAIYYNKGEWDNALELYFRAEKIEKKVGDRVGLVYTFFNIGAVYVKKNDLQSGNPYIILAGFIAMSLGMKYTLQQMAWALNPIIEEMGEEAFMKRGEEIAKSRGIL